MAKPKKLSPKYQVWADARKRHRLSHAHIQMARELGMNPKKFGQLDNHRQEPWKAPLPNFIEHLYLKRFGRERPEKIQTIEQLVEAKKRQKLERKRRKSRAAEESRRGAEENPDATPLFPASKG